MACVGEAEEFRPRSIGYCVRSSHDRTEMGGIWIPSWYDDFAHELFNYTGNVFSRTSSVNHEALIVQQFSGTTSVNKSG